MSSRVLVCLGLCVAALAAAPASASAYPWAFGPVAGNPADRFGASSIDPERYDRAFGCRRTPQPGAVGLTAWLTRHSPGRFWGILRCERLGPQNFSLHADGRAVDWHLDVRRPADRRAAVRLISLLLAPDRHGNPRALARRMGVQEIIWDCRAWFAGRAGLGPYSPCLAADGTPRRRVDRTLAHRDHIHFGLSRAGARRETSFWR